MAGSSPVGMYHRTLRVRPMAPIAREALPSRRTALLARRAGSVMTARKRPSDSFSAYWKPLPSAVKHRVHSCAGSCSGSPVTL